MNQKQQDKTCESDYRQIKTIRTLRRKSTEYKVRKETNLQSKIVRKKKDTNVTLDKIKETDAGINRQTMRELKL